MIEKFTNIGTIIDVGSGPGLFLEVGNQRGWNTYGFEPSTAAAHNSRERG